MLYKWYANVESPKIEERFVGYIQCYNYVSQHILTVSIMLTVVNSEQEMYLATMAVAMRANWLA